MRIGVPKEIKNNEYRIGIVPGGVLALTNAGHQVFVQKDGGLGPGISDEQFRQAGAVVLDSAEEIWDAADMIVKVKEPLPAEWKMMKKDQTVFTYFHLAADEELTRGCMATGAMCIAYETVEVNHSLPLLIPMSEVAGRMACQEGAKYLENPVKGRGVLLGGVPGVAPARVVILGGGVAGTNAAKLAAGLGASVKILDVNLERLRYLSDVMPNNVSTVFSNEVSILESIREADLVIGAVLILGAKAPRLVKREWLKEMKPGSVIVDISVDQGGCIETTRPTTHEAPIFIVDEVIHYCVANMPGAVAGTSTYALTNATQPFIQKLAEGPIEAVRNDHGLWQGVNCYQGKLTYKAVADAFGMEYTPLESLLG